MDCDKCGGLVVRVDEEELKCMMCSKRFYSPERRTVATSQICGERGCKSQTKGFYCSSHALAHGFQSAVESYKRSDDEEVDSMEGASQVAAVRKRCPAKWCRSDVMDGEDFCEKHFVKNAEQEVSKVLEPYLLTRQQHEANELETAPTTIERTVEAIAQPAPSKKYTQPYHLSFVVQVNSPEGWIEFGNTWKECYEGFKMINFEPDEVEGQYLAMLEKL